MFRKVGVTGVTLTLIDDLAGCHARGSGWCVRQSSPPSAKYFSSASVRLVRAGDSIVVDTSRLPTPKPILARDGKYQEKVSTSLLEPGVAVPYSDVSPATWPERADCINALMSGSGFGGAMLVKRKETLDIYLLLLTARLMWPFSSPLLTGVTKNLPSSGAGVQPN